MEALTRVGVLVEGRSIEPHQPVLVDGEVRRHPVKDHPDARLMGSVDETCKTLRLAETRCRRVQPRGLVSPRRIVGMFGDRKKLDVREAHFRDIGDQAVADLVP